MKYILASLMLVMLTLFPIHLSAQESSIINVSNDNSEIRCFTINDEEQALYYVTKKHLKHYDLHTNKELNSNSLDIDSPVTAIHKQSDGDLIFIGTKAGKVYVVSVVSGELLFVKDYEAGSINALSVMSDGSYLLCGCESGMVYKQSIEEINNVKEFFQHDKSITSITISETKQLIAISSGDGSISLFNSLTYEWIDKLIVGKEWVRKVAINVEKDRLLCVGDDGNLYEWNIVNVDKARLINQSKVSKNWLLSLDIGHEGKIECWGGLDHFIKVRTQFGSYKLKLKGPVLQTNFVDTENSTMYVACCVLGKGILIIPVAQMEYKSNF